MTTLAERVRQTRIRAGMSQAELARRIHISKNSMNKIESGKTPDPSSSVVKAVADTLGVSVDYLLGRVYEKEASAWPPRSLTTDFRVTLDAGEAEMMRRTFGTPEHFAQAMLAWMRREYGERFAQTLQIHVTVQGEPQHEQQTGPEKGEDSELWPAEAELVPA
jgi:transcriptional regulator with XRE-family HTH domain